MEHLALATQRPWQELATGFAGLSWSEGLKVRRHEKGAGQ
jgi:hypothetical protein